MQSSNAGETSRTTLGMPSQSEVLESTTPSLQSHTGDAPSSNHHQFYQSRQRVRSSRRVRSASILVTINNMPASNSEDNRDPGQDTDDPLPNQEDANVAQPENTAEHYVPWLGDSLEDLGLIPKFLIWFSPFSMIMMMTIILFWLIYQLSGSIWHDRRIPTRNIPLGLLTLVRYIIMFVTGLINWFPLIMARLISLRSPHLNKLTFRIVIVVLACLFGFLSCAYCALVSSEKEGPATNITFGQWLQTWSTGPVPQSFKGCDARVEPEQASLFNTNIYYVQFTRTWDKTHNNNQFLDHSVGYKTCDIKRFRRIQVNPTLCGQGFEGNNDLYGLGIRISLYLQWLSSFLANNFLPGTRQQLQKLYLIFSFSLCLATIIASFVKSCVFSIEIEILYWMYWGGYVCVFGSAPCPVRLGSDTKWIKLDWTTVILFTTHALMIYHGAWFVFYAYDQVLSRMPCGTYHFFFFPILDPSQGFWTLRDHLTHLLVGLLPALLASFPFLGLLLASEVKDTVQHSATYQFFFPKSTVSDVDQPQTTEHNASAKSSLALRVYLFIARPYRAFREILHLPSHSRGGIRLVTPIDIRDRRLYRLRWAAVGLLFYILSIGAIELILKYNKVSGIYSIASTGQYVSLIIGVCGFVSISWTLVLQESERRRNLKRRQVANQDENGIELDSLSHNLRDAISHAFSRPDIGFSTNGGAFPITTGEEEEEAVQSLNTPRPSRNIEAFMSGALDV